MIGENGTHETKELAYKLLGIAQSLAPTGTIQQHFANLYNQMRMAGESDKEIMIALISSVYDGLVYGNWP